MKDAFYFPHFCNARHDRKLRRVRKELGLEGYGIFFMLLEVLREQADYKYPISDIDLLADEFGTSEQKLRTVVSNYQLFQVDEEEKFFSSQLIVNLQPFLDGKKNKQLSGIRGNLIRHKYITKEQSDNMNSAEIIQKYHNLGMGSQCDGLVIAIKERKQTKETNKQKNIPFIYLAELLYNLHKKQDINYHKTEKHLITWANSIRLLVKDGRSLEDIRRVIEWCKEPDNFWFPNIQSGKKLREKFDTLISQMNQSQFKKVPADEQKNKNYSEGW